MEKMNGFYFDKFMNFGHISGGHFRLLTWAEQKISYFKFILCLGFNFGICEDFIGLYSTIFSSSLSIFVQIYFRCRRKEVPLAHGQFCDHFC